jgi:hypothetical protein
VAVRHRVPLAASNSPAAKRMRLAIILAILSREIDRQIFQSTYLASDGTQVRDFLSRLAEADCEKESFCRSILLSIEPTTQELSLRPRIDAVAQKVSSCLDELLSENQRDEIRWSITKIVHRAIDVWRPIQRAKQRYEPDFEPLSCGSDEWRLFNLPDDDSTQNEMDQNIRDESVLTVFPRVTLVTNGERSALTLVTQLMRSQKQCMSAEQELNQRPTNRTFDRLPSNRSRRKSIASNSARSNGKNFSEKSSEGG